MSSGQQAKPALALSLWHSVEGALQDPQDLRMAVLALILFFGLGCVGIPLYFKIAALDNAIAIEAQRGDLIQQYLYLRSRLKIYGHRLPKDGTLDWWTNFIIEKSREGHLEVAQWSRAEVGSKDASHIGDRKGVFFRLDTEGTYRNVLQFIGRLETQQDSVHISRINLERESGKRPMKASLLLDILTKVQEEKSTKKSTKSSNHSPDKTAHEADDL